MKDQLLRIDCTRPFSRLIMVLILVFSLVWAWFSVRWYLGNTLAEYGSSESGLRLGQLAVTLAPNDPLAHWKLGDLVQQNLPADRVAEAVREYQEAIRLSPNDYRFWMALGVALEQSGDLSEGELALRQAIRLAPAYSYPHWYLGNLLLRSGRNAEAFEELRLASEADEELKPQIFNLAWGVFRDDFESLKSSVGSSAGTRAQFAAYLLERGRVEDGLRLWNSLSDVEKKSNRETGEAIVSKLVAEKRYHQAVDIWNDLALSPNAHVTIGDFVDGGLEGNVGQTAGSPFGWKFQPVSQIQMTIDRNLGHDGGSSLRLIFQVRSRIDSIKLSQLIPVQPETNYRFQAFVKTKNLQSAGTPLIEFIDNADGSTLAASEAAPNGDNDWHPVAINFKTGTKTEAVTMRINRAPCGENPVCPIFGTIWYDDFTLQRGS